MLLFHLVILLLCVLPAASQNATDWRFFTSADGLHESWVSCFSISPSQKLNITHGSVDFISISDGINVSLAPSPGQNIPCLESIDGDLWTLMQNDNQWSGLQKLFEGEWLPYPVEDYDISSLRNPFCFLPFKDNRVLVLLPDALILYDADTLTSTRLIHKDESNVGAFYSMSQTWKNGIWLSGENGFINVLNSNGVLIPAGQRKEHICPPESGFSNFRQFFLNGEGGFIGIADHASKPAAAAFRTDGAQWELLTNEEDQPILAAWHDPENGFWYAAGENQDYSITKHENSTFTTIEKNRVTSGTFFQVGVEDDGAFWIGTSLGLARYTPSKWRTPYATRDLDTIVHDIIEDHQQRLWFASPHELIKLDGNDWSFYALPENRFSPGYRTQSLAALGSGRIAIGSMPQLLIFDPVTERFEHRSLPDSSRLELVTQKRDGNAFAFSIQDRDTGYQLSVFDDDGFHVVLDSGHHWQLHRPRYILETEDGSIWLGSSDANGFARYKDGQYTVFGKDQGYEGRGVFSMLEVEPGVIWLGGRDSVTEFDGKGFKTVLSGIEAVRTMTKSSDGSIWVAAGSGLHRNRDGLWITITSSEGLPDAAVFTVFEDSRQRIWAGTTLGLSRRFPSRDNDKPLVFIDPNTPQEVSSNGEAHISFFGYDRWKITRPERLLFSYRIDEGNWMPFSSKTQASFLNLRPGEHVFEVQAMDRNFNTSLKPAVFHFTVSLPWYRIPEFKIIISISLLIILALLLYGLSRHIRLEHLVKLRTAALSDANLSLQKEIEDRIKAEEQQINLEKQLSESQKMEAVGRLAGGVAHDFNNLLTVIIGYSDMHRTQLNPGTPLRDDMEQIYKAAEKAKELTHQLLAFGRKQILQPKIINLNSILEESVKLLRRLIGEDIEIVTRFNSKLFRVKADPVQVEQIIINICINSRDAMPNGGILTIETHNVYLDSGYAQNHASVAPGWYAMLAISDNGVGMDKATQERIFEPFFTTKEQGKGTGLGMATVYGIVKQSEGHIWLYSELNKGTTFKVYLPRVEDTNEPAAQIHVPVVPFTKTGTALLVEDSEALRDLVFLILAKNNFTVLSCGDGEEALRMANSHNGRIDLLVTDVIIPKISGKRLAELLAPKRPEMKVLYMSGYTDNMIVHHGVLDEGVAFIQKPFTPEQFLDQIRSILPDTE